MGHEGGYSNNPNDRGGETYRGISRRNFPMWSGWAVIDAHKGKPGFPESLATVPGLQKLVHGFYKMEFWNRLSLDQVNDQRIAEEMFDTAVNCGVGIAGSFLQRALNVTNRAGRDYPNLVVDSQVGPKTVGMLNMHRKPSDVLKVLNILQGNRYIEICEARESQEEFASGWLNRVSLQLS